MKQERTTPAIVIAVLAQIALAGCGGSSGGGFMAEPRPTEPEPRPTEPEPQPTVRRGISSVPGINQIPADMIKVTNKEMQKQFVIVDLSEDHARSVQQVACNSYTLQCENSGSHAGTTLKNGIHISHTGSAPYTSFVIADTGTPISEWHESQIRSMGGTAKVVVEPASPTGGLVLLHGYGEVNDSTTSTPYLVVQSAGNAVGYDGTPLPVHQHPDIVENVPIQTAIAANKVLYTAGWDKDRNGNYIRHELSMSCRGIDDGCLWAQFDFPGVGSGTSLSAPQVGSALASVLSVFPDTSHQNLAKFAKACSRKTGNGIPILLQTSGGVGVADFTCMGSVTNALASLPTGSRTNVTIDGEIVSVGGRSLSLSIPHSAPLLNSSSSVPAGYVNILEPASLPTVKDIASVRVAPTGGGKAMVTSTFTMGENMFTSVSAGVSNNFFGFVRGHENGVREGRLSAGHFNAFASLLSR